MNAYSHWLFIGTMVYLFTNTTPKSTRLVGYWSRTNVEGNKILMWSCVHGVVVSMLELSGCNSFFLCTSPGCTERTVMSLTYSLVTWWVFVGGYARCKCVLIVASTSSVAISITNTNTHTHVKCLCVLPRDLSPVVEIWIICTRD